MHQPINGGAFPSDIAARFLALVPFVLADLMFDSLPLFEETSAFNPLSILLVAHIPPHTL